MMKFVYFLYIVLANLRFSRPILLIFAIQHKITLFEFGMVQVCYFGSRVLFEFPSGILADYLKRKYSLALGSLLSGIAALLFFSTGYMEFSEPFWWFLLAAFFEGVGNSFQSGSDQAMLYDYLKGENLEEKYTKFLGWRGAISTISLGLATAIGGFLADESLSLPFLCQGVLFLFASLTIMFFPENRKEAVEERGSKTSPIKIAKAGFSIIKQIPVIQFLILFMTILATSTNAITMFMQGYLSELKVSNGLIGIIYSVCTVFSVLASLNSHHLTKLSFKTILTLTTVMFFVGTLFLLTGYVPLVIVGFLLVYIKLDLLEPSLFYFLNQFVSEDSRATVLSSFGLAQSFVTFLMYPLYGMLGEKAGYIGLILGMAVMIVPLYAYLFWFYRRNIVGDSEVTVGK
jgi:MFS family permease